MSRVAVDHDLVIVGAGPVGLSLARALGEAGLAVAVVERLARAVLAEPPEDGREIALTHCSEDILRRLDIWRHIPAEEISWIRRAEVLDGGSRHGLVFDQRQTAKDYLGAMAPNYLIRRAAYRSLEGLDNVEILDQAAVVAVAGGRETARVGLDDGRQLSCRLVVAADSRFSETRRLMGIPARSRDFGRVCIVCRMDHDDAHADTAYECFHYGRTLAVLPLPGRCSSVVITLPAEQADAVMGMAEAAFNQDVANRFERRFGAMRLTGARHAYPLVAVHADRFFARRFALVGDAAVGMHPVTAHGFNLGLRGVAILSQRIAVAQARGTDIGAAGVLVRYHRRLSRITRPLYHGTNAIVGLYTDERAPAKLLRRAMLRLGNRLPPARRAILNRLTNIPSLPA